MPGYDIGSPDVGSWARIDDRERDEGVEAAVGTGEQRDRAIVSDSLPLVVTYRTDGWTALGDPTRRAIFARLAERPSPVGELARKLPVSRPAVSQHLRVLKEAGLVIDRPMGNRRVYRVDQDGLATLRAQLERFWTTALANYKAIVEQSTEEDE
jgi:DNA-binding transcriptional ArsR family regulator